MISNCQLLAGIGKMQYIFFFSEKKETFLINVCVMLTSCMLIEGTGIKCQ